MLPLPIDDHLPEILHRLEQSRAVVLVAQPGAGKTTRMPPALLKSKLLGREHPNIVMLQPRRVAARAAAMRIAQENGWRIGQEVGWHVRFDKNLAAQTRLRVLTEGILSRQLVDDPFIEGIGAVILDEFHERSIHSDLCLALLKEIRQTVRSDLLLIVMSATLDAEPVARFLDDCPVISVQGRTFPIEIEHAAAPSGDPVSLRIAHALDYVPPGPGSDILVFLPGAREINQTAQEIATQAGRFNARIVPLHGGLPPQEQVRALEPSAQPRIILATNIAETSLTIEGVTVVIDSGLARVAGYDSQRGLDRLELKRISKASATQRAGRAGRTGPGRCIRLYTAKEFHALTDFELPEIRRVDLCSTVLALHGWGKTDVRNFGWYESPPEATLASAENLLDMLGALEGSQISSLGRTMLSLPAHPRLARLLIAAAQENLLESGAAIAALLSERDILPLERAPKTQADSDLIIRLDLINSFPQVARIRDELIRIGRSIKSGKSTHHDLDVRQLRSILVAYPDRVCRRRASEPSTGIMVGGGGVRLAPDSVVRQHEFFVAVDARQDDRDQKAQALVRIASGIEVEWLGELFPGAIHRELKVAYDPQRDQVTGANVIRYHDLVLREETGVKIDSQTASHALLEWVEPRALELVEPEPGIMQWLYRIAFLRKAMSDHTWPGPDERLVRDAFVRASGGKRTLAELKKSLSSALEGFLEYPLDRLLQTEAPESIEVPTGNHIRLEYRPQVDGQEIQAPILAVRLQEVFGWRQIPHIAGGRVAVLMHLLGPNFRPVQVTSDLASFWKSTYFQVRKDLRAQYPKHSWPEDPLTAPPQAKGRRRP